MLARVLSGAVLGVDAYLVTVEADVASGLPQFTTVGLPRPKSGSAFDLPAAIGILAGTGQAVPRTPARDPRCPRWPTSHES